MGDPFSLLQFSDATDHPGGDETPPENPPAADSPAVPGDTEPVADGPVCEVCRVPIPYAGRGRKPTRCQDHPRNRTGRDGKPAKPTGSKKTTTLAEDLSTGFGELAGVIAPVAPVTSIALAQRAQATADALVDIAEHNDAFRKGLESVAKIRPWVAIGVTVVALGTAAAVDFRVIRPDAPPAQALGITDVVVELNRRQQATQPPPQQWQPSAEGPQKVDRRVPPPPAFQMAA